jgi:hypothetical protein
MSFEVPGVIKPGAHITCCLDPVFIGKKVICHALSKQHFPLIEKIE